MLSQLSVFQPDFSKYQAAAMQCSNFFHGHHSHIDGQCPVNVHYAICVRSRRLMIFKLPGWACAYMEHSISLSTESMLGWQVARRVIAGTASRWLIWAL